MRPNLENYPIIKLAQFFSGLTAHQDVLSEMSSIMLNTTNADLVAFAEKNAEGNIHLPCCAYNRNPDPDFNYTSETISALVFKEGTISEELATAIVETLESGFLSTKTVTGQIPLSMAFLPLSIENKVSMVMIVGYVTSDRLENKMLDILLAVAGLAGTTVARLHSEKELKAHRHHLEQLVEKRTRELTALNRTLQKEVEQRIGAEKALHLQKDNLISILETMEDCIYIVSPDYKITYMNPAFQKAFTSPGNAYKTCYALLNKKTNACSWCNLESVLAGNSIRSEWHHDSSNRTYDIIETPLKNHTGNASMLAIFRDITERKTMEEKMQSQLLFEKLVADLSSYFVSLPPEQFDEGINYTLQLTGNFFQVDRSYLFQFSADGSAMSNTHEWVREGIISFIKEDQNLPVDKTPWWAQQIRTKDHVYIADVSKLPPEASAEKSVFDAQQIQSLLCVPVVKDGKLFGFFGFDSVREKQEWEDNQIALLKVIAELVVNTLIRHENDRTIRYLSFHDQLTGLYNRRYYANELQRLEGSREYPIAVISADMDGLKLINDTIGHIEGDRYLQAGAELLKNALRTSDILARVGGDEFALLMPRTDKTAAELLLNRIRRRVEQYNRAQKDLSDLPLSISLGLAVSEGADYPLEEIYRMADNNMYSDKLQQGKKARSAIVSSLLSSLFDRGNLAEGDRDQVQELAVHLGEALQLSEGRMANLILLAQVYDLGKVGLPDNLIHNDMQSNADELTEVEREALHRHPETGYRIASSSPELADVADLVLKHHEKYDGSGYPLGLKGEEIPIENRILSVVIAYSAMTNPRPYAPTLTPAQALAELKRCAGSHFDPLMVETFVNLHNL